MALKTSFLSALLVVAAVGTAQAAIVQTYTDQATFLSNVSVTPANTITFGPSGPGAFIDQTGVIATVTGGLLTLTATPGDLFGSSTVMSTDTDGAVLNLSFSQPLRAIGLRGFISDAGFAALSGQLQLTAVGSGDASFTATASGASFMGIESDSDFSTLQISISSFDTNASSVAFVALSDTVYPNLAPTQVPAPGFAALLIPAMTMAAVRRRRRTP